MTVRLRLAFIVFITGLVTALGVIATVAVAFQRFEHERTYDRANAFLDRVTMNYSDILEQHARQREAFVPWLRSLLLFEPSTQLYLLSADGTVLASTGNARLAPGFRVALAPVQQAAAAARGKQRAPYVMGDDPEHMHADAVIAARALHRATSKPGDEAAGWLYLVAQQPDLADPATGRAELFRSSLAGPALALVLALIALTTGLAAWIVVSVTRPLRVLSKDVAAAARDGFNAVPDTAPPPRREDEFGQLHRGFHALLATLRAQWMQLRELDHFRREGVSNLSHDLRSPLTATVACLETLQQRWATAPAHDEPAAAEAQRSADLQLVATALRNTRNAARLVRSLGDLALLDEPNYKLDTVLLDVSEMLDDIAMRFADRAAQQGVALRCEPAQSAAPLAQGATPLVQSTAPLARVDIELFERAIANLVDNALKFTPAGGHITLGAQLRDAKVVIEVADSGAGIAAADLPHLFDRLYQSRDSVAPATGEGGKGLGLAIVKRIVELHGGSVALRSTTGVGTVVTVSLPAPAAHSSSLTPRRSDAAAARLARRPG